MMTLNEFTLDIRGALNTITSFLGVGNFPPPTVLDISPHYDRWFIKESDRTMMDETKAILDEFYRPFNKMLQELLGHEKWAFGTG